MMGRDLKSVESPDGADGLVAVHDRHHDVHQDDVDLPGRCSVAMASEPLSAIRTVAWPRSRRAVRANMLRKSSSTTRTFVPSKGWSPKMSGVLEAAAESEDRLGHELFGRSEHVVYP